MNGRIKMYNEQKGFGFILGGDGVDRFFHMTNVKSIEQPSRGLLVSFTPSQNDKGMIATDIYINTEKRPPEFVSFGKISIKLKNIKNYGISLSDGIEYVDASPNDYMKYIDFGDIRIKYCDIIDFDDDGYGASDDVYKTPNNKTVGLYVRASSFIGKTSYRDLARKEVMRKGDIILLERTIKIPIYSDTGKDIRFYRGYTEFRFFKGFAGFDVDRKYKELKNIKYQGKKEVLGKKEEYLYITTYQNDNFQFYSSDFSIHEKQEELDQWLK